MSGARDYTDDVAALDDIEYLRTAFTSADVTQADVERLRDVGDRLEQFVRDVIQAPCPLPDVLGSCSLEVCGCGRADALYDLFGGAVPARFLEPLGD